MNKSLLQIIFLCLLSISSAEAQEFQVAFESFNVANDFSRSSDGNIFVGGFTSFMYEASVDKIVSFEVINKLDAQGQALWSRDFVVDGAFTEIHKVLALDNGDVIVLFSIDENDNNLQIGIANISGDGNLRWSKKLENEIAGFDKFNFELNLIKGDGDTFYVQSKKTNSSEQVHFLSFFNSDGQAQWTKVYPSELNIVLSTIVDLENGDLALIGFYRKNSTTLEGLVAILDAEGQIKSEAAFSGIQILDIITDQDEYILKYKNFQTNRLGLMKLDGALDIVWSKQYTFEIEGQMENMRKMTNETFAVSCYNASSRRELINLFDMDGELIWSRSLTGKYSGRSFFEKIENAAGNILMMSHIWSTDLRSSIFRQLPLDGNTAECVLPSFCLNGLESSVTRVPFGIEVIDGTVTESSIALSLSNANQTTSTFCQEPSDVPSPLFDLQETACVNQVFLPTNLNTAGADDIFWTVTGGPDNAIFPLASLAQGLPIFLQDSGQYTFTQFIQFDNCISAHTDTIEIREATPFEFSEDPLLLCQDEIATINVNRPGLIDFLWADDLSEEPIREISEIGLYTVSIFDGNCTQDYTLEVADFDYSGVAFDLGPDTTVCQFRPFTLEADVINPDIKYTWSDGPNIASRPATREGLYTLTAELDGCDFVDDILVTFEPCEAQIYMPTVFSPNADGINDTLFPQGINYELESFRIYNRWGALLHDETSPWNGETKGQIILGTYIYNISFLNIRSGDIEYITGEVFMHP